MRNSRAVLLAIKRLKFLRSLSHLDISQPRRVNKLNQNPAKTLNTAKETITNTRDEKITMIGRLPSKEESTASGKVNRSETTEVEMI